MTASVVALPIGVVLAGELVQGTDVAAMATILVRVGVLQSGRGRGAGRRLGRARVILAVEGDARVTSFQ